MNISDFESPALLIKLGGAPNLFDDPSLGQAIIHVMQQHSADRWQYDIVTEAGMMSHQKIQEAACTSAFAQWAGERRANDLLSDRLGEDTGDTGTSPLA